MHHPIEMVAPKVQHLINQRPIGTSAPGVMHADRVQRQNAGNERIRGLQRAGTDGSRSGARQTRQAKYSRSTRARDRPGLCPSTPTHRRTHPGGPIDISLLRLTVVLGDMVRKTRLPPAARRLVLYWMGSLPATACGAQTSRHIAQNDLHRTSYAASPAGAGYNPDREGLSPDNPGGRPPHDLAWKSDRTVSHQRRGVGCRSRRAS